ncbi:unnamed protein product [Caenorhabditis bovis]|uniref:Uncharacterized protein n=1 Tax=Caenorhabditis bovis TaxID=2654633 RepID=A0A8S1F9E4_9PELO|nr:unnamed protein product [Caenorhabditis bovis]
MQVPQCHFDVASYPTVLKYMQPQTTSRKRCHDGRDYASNIRMALIPPANRHYSPEFDKYILGSYSLYDPEYKLFIREMLASEDRDLLIKRFNEVRREQEDIFVRNVNRCSTSADQNLSKESAHGILAPNTYETFREKEPVKSRDMTPEEREQMMKTKLWSMLEV